MDQPSAPQWTTESNYYVSNWIILQFVILGIFLEQSNATAPPHALPPSPPPQKAPKRLILGLTRLR